jgi:hypothetical protein
MFIPTAAHVVAIVTLTSCGLIAIALIKTMQGLDR